MSCASRSPTRGAIGDMKRWMAESLRQRPLRMSTDALWLVIVLAGALVITSLVPLPPNDFWWHLKIGELIVETGHLPTTNMLAWTLPADAPFVYGAWLGEALFYLLYRLGHLELVIFTRTLLLGFALLLVGYEAACRSGSWRLAALAVGLTFAMSLNNLIVRPQNWSWVPFAVFLAVLRATATGRWHWTWLLLCPIATATWANLHGAFVLGPILVGLSLVGETLGRLLKRSDAVSWTHLGRLVAVTGLTCLAPAANPQGFGIFRYVANLMLDPPSQGLIVEWQSPTPNGIANTAFFVTLLLLLVAIWLSRRAPRPTDVLFVAAFTWLAWSGMRYVVWFGMVAMPILAEVVAGLVSDRRLLRSPTRNAFNCGLAALILVPVVLVQPWFVESLPLPESYRTQVHWGAEEGPLLSVETPLGAGAWLAENPGGRMFNEMGYGSYFIWALPEQQVFVDPRVELYPVGLWDDYRKISYGVRYADLLGDHRAERVVLDVVLQEELSLALASDARWRMVYKDSRSQVWDALLP